MSTSRKVAYAVAVTAILAVTVPPPSVTSAQERGQVCIRKELVCVERKQTSGGAWICTKHKWKCTLRGHPPASTLLKP